MREMIDKAPWSRRTFLRGVGATLALPFLASLRGTAAEAVSPKRMAFVYVPNGVNMADWTPKQEGAEFDLPYILEPLAGLRREFSILSGLSHQKANANGDGPGDHARASASFLTAVQARKTAAVDVRAGISVDQVVARKIGKFSRIPSLELTCDKGQQAGSCDSGYSCAYQFNLSWKDATTPLPPEVDPRLVFDRLFPGSEGSERGGRTERSILDFVLEDAKGLRRKLGRTDQGKLDEYMTSVRDVEQRLQQAQNFKVPKPDYPKPGGIPRDYEEHIRLMFDLLALAFQTDSTRVSSLMLAHDGSNRAYPFIGIADGHHDLSHHGGNAEKKKKIARINRFHLEQFARFLEKLRATPEGEGSLLDHCMIVYGSGIADGNEHSHIDLPVLLAGKASGTLQPGRHLRYEKGTPMANLFLSMLERMDVETERLGDSTGKLAYLG